MSTGKHEPVVARRRLKVELRQGRKSAGKTQKDVAEAMDWSTAKLIRVESGEAKISRNDLKALLEYYGITDPDHVAELHEIARVVREEESWSDYRDLMSLSSRRFFGFEAASAVIRSFQPIVVPGQLQTEEYFRALMKVLEFSDDVIDRGWDLRLRRQRMHDRDAPPKMHFIIDEAAVRRPVGGWRVMKRQLIALQDYAAQPHITIQILPFAAGAHPGLNARFVILEFDDANEDDLVFLEEPDTELRDDPEDTSTFIDRFFRLAEIALPATDTVSFLDGVIAVVEAEGLPSPL